MSQNRKDTDFLYASSRIKALERTLLTRERVDRMLDSKTLEDAVKVLYECEYSESGQEVAPSRYEVLLSREREKVLALLSKLAPEIVPLFMFPNDYLNIKILLKMEFLGAEDEPIFAEAVQIPVMKLRQAIRERTFDGMTAIMKRAAQEVIDSFGKTSDPQSIDLILDGACYEDMMATAKEFDSPFIIDYVRREIDLANIKALIRIKHQGGGRDTFQRAFMPGGELSVTALSSRFDDDFGQLAQGLAFTAFGRIIEGAAGVLTAGNLGTFEKLCDDYRMERIKAAKLVAFGVEPIVGFVVAKENDIKNARIILAGKAAGLAADKLAERVRETYV
jgi:V/A-type H+-transporting ATPase subunit C